MDKSQKILEKSQKVRETYIENTVVPRIENHQIDMKLDQEKTQDGEKGDEEDELVYQVDENGFLIDENGQYLLDEKGEYIKFDDDQMDYLEKNDII